MSDPKNKINGEHLVLHPSPETPRIKPMRYELVQLITLEVSGNFAQRLVHVRVTDVPAGVSVDYLAVFEGTWEATLLNAYAEASLQLQAAQLGTNSFLALVKRANERNAGSGEEGRLREREENP